MKIQLFWPVMAKHAFMYTSSQYKWSFERLEPRNDWRSDFISEKVKHFNFTQQTFHQLLI